MTPGLKPGGFIGLGSGNKLVREETMKQRLMQVAVLILVTLVWTSAGLAAGGKKIILTPNELQWKQGPAAIPGAQMSVLEGEPGKHGFFVARLKVTAGTKIPPHVHGETERVTVISGKMNLAMGTMQDNPIVLPPGSYISLPTKTVHNAWFDEETILQISTNGPWSFKPVKAGKSGGGR
jgi:quercetin dioxygenase-like cupin family protein